MRAPNKLEELENGTFKASWKFETCDETALRITGFTDGLPIEHRAYAIRAKFVELWVATNGLYKKVAHMTNIVTFSFVKNEVYCEVVRC